MTLLSTVLAQVELPAEIQKAEGITIPQIITWFLSVIVVIAAIAFFAMLILGGIRWILSGGDKANTEAARNQVTAAIIGLIVVFGGIIIVNFIGGLFGFNINAVLGTDFTTFGTP